MLYFYHHVDLLKLSDQVSVFPRRMTGCWNKLLTHMLPQRRIIPQPTRRDIQSRGLDRSISATNHHFGQVVLIPNTTGGSECIIFTPAGSS